MMHLVCPRHNYWAELDDLPMLHAELRISCSWMSSITLNQLIPTFDSNSATGEVYLTPCDSLRKP
jgi:hypothetical protein